MATYASQVVGKTRVAGTYNSAGASGDKFPPGSLLHVKNGNASPAVGTWTTPGVVDQDVPITDPTAGTWPATTGEGFVWVPDDNVYKDPADGLVTLTFAPNATVTIAVVRTPRT